MRTLPGSKSIPCAYGTSPCRLEILGGSDVFTEIHFRWIRVEHRVLSSDKTFSNEHWQSLSFAPQRGWP